jgi:arylsulfatase A
MLAMLLRFVGCAGLMLTVSATGAAERPPNVVLIVVDDLGWKDLGCQGSTVYETPNIDALAAQGMRFTQAYAACAVCSPTRAAVLTGKYPARLGVTDWIRPEHSRDPQEYAIAQRNGYVENAGRILLTPANQFELKREETTLAERLKTAGYATCHVGKWHLGGRGHLPTDQGFDRNVGGWDFGQPPSYFDPYANARLPDGIPTLPPRKGGEYLSDREADEAVAFIHEQRGRPFLLSYWPYAVHTPLQASRELVERYRSRNADVNPTYAAMIHSMDAAVGRIMAALEEGGLTEQTLVVFTSDNGGLLSSTSNAPLRSGKGYPYEGGLRVPLIVRWPGVVPAGRTSDVPACSIDLAPTICEAAGVDFPTAERDGVSLWKYLTSENRPVVDRETLIWHFPHYRQQDVVPYSVIRSGAWKLIRRYEEPQFELFNLSTDPNETSNLAAGHSDLVARLDTELTEHLRAIGATLPKAASDSAR